MTGNLTLKAGWVGHSEKMPPIRFEDLSLIPRNSRRPSKLHRRERPSQQRSSAFFAAKKGQQNPRIAKTRFFVSALSVYFIQVFDLQRKV